MGDQAFWQLLPNSSKGFSLLDIIYASSSPHQPLVKNSWDLMTIFCARLKVEEGAPPHPLNSPR